MMRFLWLSLIVLLSACVLPTQPTMTPTRVLSAPTLAVSTTPVIRSSGELYPTDEGAFIGQTNPTQAALPVDSEPVPIPHAGGASDMVIDVVLEDGSVLQGDLYTDGTTRQAGILLVGVDRLAWGTLPLALQSAGYTVLVMEIGDIPQAQHVEVMLRTFINLGSVDPSRIGVIGEAQAADVALVACAFDTLCDAVALFSPLTRDTLLNVMPSYGMRPLLLMTSNQDAESYPVTLALSQVAQGEMRFIETIAGRGASIIQLQPEYISEVVAWFVAYLAP